MSVRNLFISIGLIFFAMPISIFAGSFLPYPVPIVFKNETQTTFQLCTSTIAPPIVETGWFTFPQILYPGSYPYIAFTVDDKRACYNGTSCLYMVMYYGYKHNCQLSDPAMAMVVEIGTRHGETTTCYASTTPPMPYKCHASADSNAVTITIENKK